MHNLMIKLSSINHGTDKVYYIIYPRWSWNLSRIGNQNVGPNCSFCGLNQTTLISTRVPTTHCRFLEQAKRVAQSGPTGQDTNICRVGPAQPSPLRAVGPSDQICSKTSFFKFFSSIIIY